MSPTFLATTSPKFSTSFCSFWQSCAAYFPTTWLLPCSALITRRWMLWSCNHYLAPSSYQPGKLPAECCCMRAAFVREYLLLICLSCFRAWLIRSKLLVRSCNNITNPSNGLIKLSTDSGVAAKEQRAGVTSSQAFHVSHAVSLSHELL